jgi:ubiquinone/menaquinone biosynthesis C-methylase UbiE
MRSGWRGGRCGSAYDEADGAENIEAPLTDVHDLPFEGGHFDAIYMIAVIGEIPSPEKAMKEFFRVLGPSGTLAFSEFLNDPDYPRAGTLIHQDFSAGFRLRKKVGSFFHYTLIFEKGCRLAAPDPAPSATFAPRLP